MVLSEPALKINPRCHVPCITFCKQLFLNSCNSRRCLVGNYSILSTIINMRISPLYFSLCISRDASPFPTLTATICRQYLTRPCYMLVCSRDWFHSERKHVEDARPTRKEYIGGSGHKTREKEKELSTWRVLIHE